MRFGLPATEHPSLRWTEQPERFKCLSGNGQALAGKPITVLFWLAPPFYNSTAGFVAEVQSIINNDDNFPVMVANYFRANPDSYVNATCDGGAGQDCQATQAARGSTWVNANQGVLRLQNPAGKYAIVGFEHWSMWDSFSQFRNFGLFTGNDNGYDGSSAATGVTLGACATSHTYAIPSICTDSNGKFESLAANPAGCTTSSGAPTWNTNFWGLTSDANGCPFFNNLSYTRVAETANFGDALLPVVRFNLSNLADPGGPSGPGPAPCPACFAMKGDR